LDIIFGPTAVSRCRCVLQEMDNLSVRKNLYQHLFAGAEPKISSFKPSHYTDCGSQTALSCHQNHLAGHRSGISFELINANCYFAILLCKLTMFQMTR